MTSVAQGHKCAYTLFGGRSPVTPSSFDGFGAPDPFNQNDDDQMDQGESNAAGGENPEKDANMVSDDEANEYDDSFVQLASNNLAKKGDGSDGFGAQTHLPRTTMIR